MFVKWLKISSETLHKEFYQSHKVSNVEIILSSLPAMLNSLNSMIGSFPQRPLQIMWATGRFLWLGNGPS